jgi:hypothetical protein
VARQPSRKITATVVRKSEIALTPGFISLVLTIIFLLSGNFSIMVTLLWGGERN